MNALVHGLAAAVPRAAEDRNNIQGSVWQTQDLAAAVPGAAEDRKRYRNVLAYPAMQAAAAGSCRPVGWRD